MRLLYCAIDQRVPGTTGGSVHVRAVAEGLAALGHEVHVLATPGPGGFPAGRVTWHAMHPPLGRRELRWTRRGAVSTIARRLRPDLVIERYYNFGGEGIVSAARAGIAGVLEVNAPVIDYPGSPKARLDRALLFEPMRRWREHVCRLADVIVTPSAAIVPHWIPPARVLSVEWGADTTRFEPGAKGIAPFSRQAGDVVAIFAGAFRAWHGAHHLVDAFRLVHQRGGHRLKLVLAGDGPELPLVREKATGLSGITILGAVPHEVMPATLAAADVGAAPFDVAAHPPLALDFYWSPLKVFEYMASGLPVVAPRLPRLAGLVEDGREGVLYAPPTADALAGALESLLDDGRRREMGTHARVRAERDYSWSAHCRALERAFHEALERRRHGAPAP